MFIALSSNCLRKYIEKLFRNKNLMKLCKLFLRIKKSKLHVKHSHLVRECFYKWIGEFNDFNYKYKLICLIFYMYFDYNRLCMILSCNDLGLSKISGKNIKVRDKCMILKDVLGILDAEKESGTYSYILNELDYCKYCIKLRDVKRKLMTFDFNMKDQQYKYFNDKHEMKFDDWQCDDEIHFFTDASIFYGKYSSFLTAFEKNYAGLSIVCPFGIYMVPLSFNTVYTNFVELIAIYLCLSMCDEMKLKKKVIIYTDCFHNVRYLNDGECNFKRRNEVNIMMYFKCLAMLKRMPNVKIEWVKAHQSITAVSAYEKYCVYMNNQADKYARLAAKWTFMCDYRGESIIVDKFEWMTYWNMRIGVMMEKWYLMENIEEILERNLIE